MNITIVITSNNLNYQFNLSAIVVILNVVFIYTPKYKLKLLNVLS